MDTPPNQHTYIYTVCNINNIAIIIVKVNGNFSKVVQLHLQLRSDEQAKLVFPHLQLAQSPLLNQSLHAFETSGIVIQTGCHDCVEEALVQAKSCGDGIICCI